MRRAVLLIVCASCAHHVRQDAATGPDGKIAGARPMDFEDGVAIATGIVTYPGGDRVDWKRIELGPRKGRLDLELSFVAPRRGLSLGFDVFDENLKPLGKKVGKKRLRKAYDDVRGTVYVRVYAVGRGDAGTYRLRGKMFPYPEVAVPYWMDWFPLGLHAMFHRPPAPIAAQPPSPPPRRCVTLDPNDPVCQAVMPCPDPPDVRLRSCARKFGNILSVWATQGGSFVRIDRGRIDGVGLTSTAEVIDFANMFVPAKVGVVGVEKDYALVHVALPPDEIKRAGLKVRFAR